MRAKLWLAAAVAAVSVPAADLPEDRGAAGVYRKLKGLETRARVLYVVAHPDDEDAATLTLLARGYGAEVRLMSITRGESGANLITGDFFDRLGILRTLEHRRAARSYGVDLRYTRWADFGYSKSVDETWRNWKHDEVIKDVVYHIRAFRPHVILSRFQGTARDGHGHHTAAGQVAREAFEAASDAARFEDAGPAWKPSRLFTSGGTRDEAGVVALESGVSDPVLGRSYAEIGREGYRFQRSQAMGAVMARPGPFAAYYRLAAGAPVAPGAGLFAGLEEATLPPEPFRTLARQALQRYRADRPEELAPMLARGLQEAQKQGFDDLARKFEDALRAVLGVEVEALVEPGQVLEGMAAQFRTVQTLRAAVAGAPFRVAARVVVRSRAAVETVALEASGENIESKALGGGRLELTWRGGRTSAVHWSRGNPFEQHYVYSGGAQWMGLSLPPPILAVRARLRYLGCEFSASAVPETRSIDRIGLEVREPVSFGPKVAVRFTSSTMILPLARRSFAAEVVVRAVGPGERAGRVRLTLPESWRSLPEAADYRLAREGEEWRGRFEIEPAGVARGRYEIGAVAESGGERFTEEFEEVRFEGLESAWRQAPAKLAVSAVDVKVAPGLKVGYVMGTGDEVPEALRQLGATVELLDAGAVASADLKRFNAILLGIRAYAARPVLKVHNARLLEYVRGGGTLIVQYNTQEFDQNLGPYPYSMTMRAEEASEEDAPVRILEPGGRVFRWPNRITEADFNGWVEQRGSKFFTTWDPQYKPMVETHDRGQAEQRGVWLQAQYGRGLYVYCALAWYRQLPFGVEGAARVFANLISQAAAPKSAAGSP